MSRIAIIGTGAVGTTFAYSLMISGIAEEIVLIDVNKAKAEAEAMDLNHGQSFVKPVRLWSGEYADCGAAEIVVITAGAKQKPGENRLDLVTRNVAILKDIIANIKTSGYKGILLLVSNPVDVLTYFAWKLSGYDRQKVIGSGTVLDSARFKQLLARHCEVSPQSVHAYIIGEHGDSEVPAWSLTNIAGVNLKQYCPQCNHNHLCHKEMVMDEIFEQVRTSAYKIIAAKGATYYAIGLSLVKIVQAILRDENQVLPISSILIDVYGLNDVALSVPTIVNRNGASKQLTVPLEAKELQALQNSAKLLKEVIASIKY
jgi:L-lactate dehydrogenase